MDKNSVKSKSGSKSPVTVTGLQEKKNLTPPPVKPNEQYLKKKVEVYSEGESGSEFPIKFTDLRPKQKIQRILVLWKKTITRAKMAYQA